MRSRFAALVSLLTFSAVLIVFVRTLAPGLVAITDTPKFQFIGRILGTAHNPGYPLYVVVSHVFGYLPVGSLAWRINLMSAIFGAGTVALAVLTATATGCRPLTACAIGLGLAFGSSFWLTSTIAEVYTLHAFLVAAMTYSLVRWRASRQASWFFLAIGCFALGLGHHTTIVVIAPAVAIFGLLAAPAFALSARTMGGVALLLAAGFAQYLFVLVRTLQGVWGESPAHNLRELFDVIRGAQFTFALEPLALDTIGRRAPMIGRLVMQEVSPAVCVFAAAGCVALIVRDRTLLALFALSFLGVAAFGTFYRVMDITLFLLPAYFFLWLLTAHGVDGIVRALGRDRRWPFLAAAVPLFALAAWQFNRNVDARDLSHDRLIMRHFDALFRQVPERSAILNEDFLVDRMMLYETLGEEATRGRDVLAPVAAVRDPVTSLASSGYQVFAFEKSATELRRGGAEFEYAAWPLVYGPFRQFLTDQPEGTVVALAVPAMQLGPALQHDALPLDVIGGQPAMAAWTNLAAIGVIGRSGDLQAQAGHSVSVYAAHTAQIGQTGVTPPADILAEATVDGASIRVGARELIRSASAPVAAVWDRRGDLLRAFALTPDGKVPMTAGPVSVHRLRALRDWTSIGSSPTDITAPAAGGHVMVAAGAAPLVIYAGRTRALAPVLLEPTPQSPSVAVQEFAGGSAALEQSLLQDGWPVDSRLGRFARVYRIEVGVADQQTHLGFGGLPDIVLAASATSGDPPRVYGLDLTGQLEPIDARTDRLHVARDYHAYFLGAGWSGVSSDQAGAFRATVDPEAELTIPCGLGTCVAADFQLRPVGEGGPIDLSVNGVALPPQTVRADWNRYRWMVPASALRPGMNAFVLKPARPVLLADVLFEASKTRDSAPR